GLAGEVVHGGGGIVDVPLCFGLGQRPFGGGGDVIEGGLTGVGESGGRAQRVRRRPDHASAGGGRSAQLCGLLEDDDTIVGVGGAGGGRESGRARTDDGDVDVGGQPVGVGGDHSVLLGMSMRVLPSRWLRSDRVGKAASSSVMSKRCVIRVLICWVRRW